MSSKTLPSRRCAVKRSGAGGTDPAAGFSKPFFVSMDDRLSNFWAAGASFDSGTIKLQLCPTNTEPQDSLFWQDITLYPDIDTGRPITLSANGLMVFSDAQIFNCWARFAWTGVGVNGDFVAYVT